MHAGHQRSRASCLACADSLLASCSGPARPHGAAISVEAHHHHPVARGRHRPRHAGAALRRALSQAFGKPVVVENKPGSAGVDRRRGHPQGRARRLHLAVATSAVMAIRPTLFKVRPYDPLTDFVPIALYVKSPFMLVVNPSLPVKTAPELIKYIKERPGQLSYSSSGIGGAPHLSAELLKQRFGLRPCPCALSQQPAVDRRRRRRPRRCGVRRGRRVAAADQGRQAARARGHRRRRGSRRCRNCRRSAKPSACRTSRRCRGTCCLPATARRADRGQAAWRDEAHHGDARDAQRIATIGLIPLDIAVGRRHSKPTSGPKARSGAALVRQLGPCRLAMSEAPATATAWRGARPKQERNPTLRVVA